MSNIDVVVVWEKTAYVFEARPNLYGKTKGLYSQGTQEDWIKTFICNNEADGFTYSYFVKLLLCLWKRAIIFKAY